MLDNDESEVTLCWPSPVSQCWTIRDFLPLPDDRQQYWPQIFLFFWGGFHNSEARLDVYSEWWSAPDLHYGNAITTGVYNRMCLLVAFGRCLRVVRKWEQQHPGDRRAAVGVAVLVGGGASACVAPVITLRLPVSQNRRAKKPSVSHPTTERWSSVFTVMKLVFWCFLFFFKSAATLKRL